MNFSSEFKKVFRKSSWRSPLSEQSDLPIFDVICTSISGSRLLLSPLQTSSVCCACGKTTSEFKRLRQFTFLECISVIFGSPEEIRIPECRFHAPRSRFAQFYFRTLQLHADFHTIMIAGYAPEFLAFLRERYTHGDYLAPWRFRNDCPLDRVWSVDGLSGDYAAGWSQFWQNLTDVDQQKYFVEWKAPSHWKSALESRKGPWDYWLDDTRTSAPFH